MRSDDSSRCRWRRSQRITAWLLGAWFLLTFCVVFFARELALPMFGGPFSFWAASQGLLIVYVLLVWVYARSIHRLDVEFGLAEAD